MEFFREQPCHSRPEDLRKRLCVDNLPAWCRSVERVLDASGETGRVWTVWGEFAIRREVVCRGVRFTLPGCPNALQWTVTVEPVAENQVLRVHLTINQKTHEADFIESLETFVGQTCAGALSLLSLP